jgi:mRNA-degrading endonuclease toxin of MazEF toxin-antitoxin module
VLVVSHDSFNSVAAWKSVTVVPLTTSANQARRGPTAVPIPDGAGGLRGDGIAVCHQITTLDRGKLTRRLGALPADVLTAVEVGIKAALDLS